MAVDVGYGVRGGGHLVGARQSRGFGASVSRFFCFLEIRDSGSEAVLISGLSSPWLSSAMPITNKGPYSATTL
jgi:hypothetical protein